MSSSPPEKDKEQGKPKNGRAPTSCLECQRRKQKCSREWPCNHCQSRKVPHLCHFATKKSSPDGDSPGSNAQTSKKRKDETFESPSSTISEDPEIDLANGLAKLGYMPTHQVFDLGRAAGNDGVKGPMALPSGQTEEIEAALKNILPKPYTDCLVQNFLNGSNYQYYSIYPPELLKQCEDWWILRASGQRLQPEITCLLLRVCACSTQYLEKSLRERLEFELGEKAQALTDRFHTAAQKLSATITPGGGGIPQVQQLFLVATWYKSEAFMVESWHAISAAVREAQELGMHEGTAGKNLDPFEREMRRRLWCILWVWDWQMSTILSRPIIIDHSRSIIEAPDETLEANPSTIGKPSPLHHVLLQLDLGRQMDEQFQALGSEVSSQQVLDFEKGLEDWMATFPPALRMTNRDSRWDEKYPNIGFQRCQVNIIAYCYILAPLKAYLTGTPKSATPEEAKNLRCRGVNACIDLVKVAKEFYDLMYPDYVKFHFILFLMFDACTVLCSAILHDTDNTLPRREDAIAHLRMSIDAMENVSDLSKTAVMTASVLKKLVTSLPLSTQERMILEVSSSKRQKRSSPASDNSFTRYSTTRNNSASFADYSLSGLAGDTSSYIPPPVTSDWQLNDGLPVVVDELTNNLGHLEQLWHWEHLDLDFSAPLSTNTL